MSASAQKPSIEIIAREVLCHVSDVNHQSNVNMKCLMSRKPSMSSVCTSSADMKTA